MFRFWKQVSLFVPAAIAGVALLLLSTAWFHIQAVRLGYQSQKLRQQIEDMKRREEILDQRLQQSLSLPRLDQLAKDKFGLKIPSPTQIVLLSDASVKP